MVTPSSLTNNWAAEVQKWLGSERCKALVMQPGPGADSQVGFFQLAHVIDLVTHAFLSRHKKLSTSCTACNAQLWLAKARSAVVFGREMSHVVHAVNATGPGCKPCMVSDTVRPAVIELLWLDVQVTDFKHGKQWPIMVVSYETLRKFADGLAGFCDILICDEGHRYAATWQHARCPHQAYCCFYGTCVITHFLTVSIKSCCSGKSCSVSLCMAQLLLLPVFAFALLCLSRESRP